MRSLIVICEQFEVVTVPFPFTDSSVTKRRPALVLSNAAAFNTLVGRSVMAMITTATHSPWVLDVPISNLEEAELKVPSVIRMKLFTLDHTLILKRIGHLVASDRVTVEQALRALLKLP
jgi:mRNA interferase MazF